MTGTLADRLAAIRERIAAAIERRGPGPAVTLVAVSKRHPVSAIREAMAAGVRDFGENYAQDLRDKADALADATLQWHFIGHLQTNKVKHVVGRSLIHTVDRPKLVTAIDKRAQGLGIEQSVLVEVNIAAEASKSGVAPAEVGVVLDAIAAAAHVRCVGLMAIPPPAPPDIGRRYFSALREVRDRLAPTRTDVDLQHLSMGMSADFEAAIECGATLVRVGTALFGPRPL